MSTRPSSLELLSVSPAAYYGDFTIAATSDFEAELKQFNGEDDHVHLLVHYPPKVQLSKLVNSLKQAHAQGHRSPA